MIPSLNSWLWHHRLSNVTTTKAQHWSRRHLGVSYHNCDRKIGMYFFYAVGPIMLMPIHHYSTLNKEMLLSWMLETFCQLSKLQGQDHWKIGSGESVTWLVSNCDVTAGLLPLRYIIYVTKIICMYYKGIIIRQVRHLKCFACIDLKKDIDAHALDEFAGIYKATLFSR